MLLPICLITLAALTPVRSQQESVPVSCDSGWSWAPVFFIAKGDVYSGGSCSGTPLLSCAFDGAQPLPGGLGSATVTCSSLSVFTITLQVLGQNAGSASGPAGDCASAGPVSANVDCDAGLLIYLVVGIAVLLLVCCCVSCCRCQCCRGDTQRGSGPAYILLPSTSAQPAPAAFYTEKRPASRGTYIAPSQGYA